MIKKVAFNLGTWLAQKSGEVEKINVLIYGLEYIISSLVKILCLLFGSWALGIFSEAIAFLLSAIPLRLFSGGAHSKTFWRCCSVSIISTFIFSFMAKYLLLWTLSNGIWLQLVGVFSFFMMYRFAPNNPIVELAGNTIRFRILRTGSILLPIVWYIVVQMFINKTSLIQASAYGLLWQSITVTPIGNKLLARLDYVFEGKGGEKIAGTRG